MTDPTDTQADARIDSTDRPSDGKVYLVGAGPGDPDLLTVKARRLIETCDVVLHDSLVSDDVLAVPGPDVSVVDVGKRPGDDGRRWTQADIHDRMVAEAEAGNSVVRLKGGDPGVFGRGGEEAQVLAERGIQYEVVPGLTSAIAAPELAGIPLTHRDHASSLTVITGHEDPTKDDTAIDWDAIAGTVTAGGTLVILMGVRNLPANVAALRDRGVDPSTPVAIVERATLGDEAVTLGTLATVVDRARRADVSSPAVILVGDVVSVLDDVVGAIDSRVLAAEGSVDTRQIDGRSGDRERDQPPTERGSAAAVSEDVESRPHDARGDRGDADATRRSRIGRSSGTGRVPRGSGATDAARRRGPGHLEGVTIPTDPDLDALEGVPGKRPESE